MNDKTCGKCKGTCIVDNSGLIILERMTGGLAKADHPPVIYPCPNCCLDLHKLVAKQYHKFHEQIAHSDAIAEDQARQLAQEQVENKRLGHLLARYGNHMNQCGMPAGKCTCGWADTVLREAGIA